MLYNENTCFHCKIVDSIVFHPNRSGLTIQWSVHSTERGQCTQLGIELNLKMKITAILAVVFNGCQDIYVLYWKKGRILLSS